MKKVLLGSILAAASVAAQPTGDWGRAAMMGDGMYGGSGLHAILWTIFAIGLILLVWLWVIKLWKEVRRMK